MYVKVEKIKKKANQIIIFVKNIMATLPMTGYIWTKQLLMQSKE